MSQEIVDAVRDIEREKGIEQGALVTALEDALLAAYKKTPGAARHATVELDEQGDFRVFSMEIPPDLEERLLDEARERAFEELERVEEETGEKNHTLISDDDLDLEWSEVPDDIVKREDVTPDNFGRIAAQTAKQVILQRIREAEREMMYDEYIDRVGEVVTGIVQQAGDRNNVLVDLGKVESLLPRSEQVDGERYEQGSRIKAVITEVRTGTKGPQVILSRRDPELIKTLFELEVPEIADGLVEIRGVAREPGYRSKIAVESHAQGVDPVGACVGPRGSRVRMVVSELRGEKIDIIPWNPEPARFVAKALSPARVREVYLDDEAREATVVTPDDQLALAIGKEGMNARLAHRLTGWKIDIVSDSEFAQQEAQAAFGGADGEEGEDFSGRCSAILSNGKRCPNAALPGSKYCGVAAHQELANRATEQVVESEPELEIAADAIDTAPAGPGDAVVAGADETLETGGAAPERVHDDPLGGIPIEQSAGAPSVDEDGDTDVEQTEAAAVDTPVDVTGGAGIETTLEGHDRTAGEVLYTGPDTEREDANA
jgi:N utilization substance protein A